MNNNEKIFFTKDSAPIIFNMLKKNGLEETKEDFLKRLSEKKLLQGEVIIDTAEKIFLKKDTKDNLIIFLQTELNTSTKIATQVYNDIMEKLIPIADKYTLGNVTESINQPIKKIKASKDETLNAKKKILTDKEDSYREKI